MHDALSLTVPRSGATAFVRDRIWPLAVWVGMLGWSAALFGIVRHDFQNFRLAKFDLGNMVQAVWSTAQGRPLETTDAATGDQLVRLASHVDPILVLLAPLWTILPSPLTLAAVQIAACALGALPVFWLGRRHLESEGAAALLAFAYLAYPWLAWAALDAIHPVTIATPLLLYCIWFLDSDRLLAFLPFGALVLATGELLGLSVFALGLWYALARKRHLTGLGIAGVGLVWTALCLKVIIPAFGSDHSPFYGRFETVGGSPAGLLQTALSDPATILAAITTRDDLAYVSWLTAPLVAAFLLSPLIAAVAIPQLLVNLLSDLPTTTDPRHHYIGPVLPFLVAGTVLGLARLSARGRVLAAGSVLATSVAISLVAGPWPGAPGTRPVAFHWRLPETHVDALDAAVARIPKDAPVSSTNIAGSHLSERRYVYSVPVLGRSEWILVDTWNAWMIPSRAHKSRHPLLLRRFLDRIDASPRWRLVFERDDVRVYRKVGA